MPKILIAEDERDIRDLVIFTLQFGGFEVVAAGNGAELVELAPREKPDLILSDVRMPKMTGYEACVALKANPATKDIPVVFLSAKGQEEEVSQGMAAGATAYILKPFAPDVLLTKVKDIMAAHAKPKAAPAAKAEPAAAPKPAPQAEPVAKTETASKTEMGPKTETAAKAEPAAAPAPVTKTESTVKTEGVTKTEGAPKSEPAEKK